MAPSETDTTSLSKGEQTTVAQTEQQTSTKAYIHNLPIELLGDIASILAALDPHSIWTFASVCQYWRDAALSYPTCWAHIHVKDTEQDLSRLKDPKTALWLSRAKTSQLELRLDGRTTYLLKSEPLNTISLARIGRLHLGSWDGDVAKWLSWGSLHFEALEVLSICGRDGVMAMKVNFDIILETLFVKNEAGEMKLIAPRLQELSLSDVFINRATFPNISTLQSLKFDSCTFADDISFINMAAQAKDHLKSLCLSNVYKRYPVFGATVPGAIEEIELPHLTSLTIVDSSTTRPSIEEFIKAVRCPAVSRLTCDDQLIAYLSKEAFPAVTHLSIGLTKCGSKAPYERLLTTLKPSHLTIYRPSVYSSNGMQILVWMAIQTPSIGASLKQMRFISYKTAVVTETLVGRLNKARLSKEERLNGGKFVRELILRPEFERDCCPWDSDLWWTREDLWRTEEN